MPDVRKVNGAMARLEALDDADYAYVVNMLYADEKFQTQWSMSEALARPVVSGLHPESCQDVHTMNSGDIPQAMLKPVAADSTGQPGE